MSRGEAAATGREGRLSIRGIDCRCRIGVTAEERGAPQRIEVDVDLYLDLSKAVRTADLGSTIDYRAVCDAVRGGLESGEHRLIETAAGSVLDLVLRRFPAERAVVRLRKFVLPGVRHVEVELERRGE